MALHRLKIHPEYFDAVADGKKRFEIRKNDRGFEERDTLLLCEWNPESEKYTGRQVFVVITYILKEFGCGLSKEWVVLSISLSTSSFNSFKVLIKKLIPKKNLKELPLAA